MRTSLRWAVPAAVTASIAASVLVAPQLASADPELPPTTAAELLVKVATAQQQAFSGTVVQNTDLGLPQLDPEEDRAMICGGPAMLKDMRGVLDEAGFTISPGIGHAGDYVIERAFVEK